MAKPRGRSASKKGRGKLGAPTARKRRPQLKADELDWKNYPSLRRFLSERGKIRSRRITGLSRRQQSMLSAAVKRAREMGLLPYPDQDRKVRVSVGPEIVPGTIGEATSTDVEAVVTEDGESVETEALVESEAPTDDAEAPADEVTSDVA